MIVIAIVVVVGVVGALFIKGASPGPTIGDTSTLPPQMKQAYGMSGGKPPAQQPQGQ